MSLKVPKIMSLKVPNNTVLLIVGLMLVTLASSAAFAAGRVEVGSRVTLEQDYAFHGKVRSYRAACERNRTVAVYQVRGRAPTASTRMVTCSTLT
jgi:hypothetical protein